MVRVMAKIKLIFLSTNRLDCSGIGTIYEDSDLPPRQGVERGRGNFNRRWTQMDADKDFCSDLLFFILGFSGLGRMRAWRIQRIRNIEGENEHIPLHYA
jgi:hypothetical protein